MTELRAVIEEITIDESATRLRLDIAKADLDELSKLVGRELVVTIVAVPTSSERKESHS